MFFFFFFQKEGKIIKVNRFMLGPFDDKNGSSCHFVSLA